MEIEKLLTIFDKYREKYLCKKSGSLLDVTLSNNLIGQYHYGCFILSAVLAHNNEPNRLLLKDIELVFSFLNSNLKEEVVKSSIDFNVESICLAHWICEDVNLKSFLKSKLVGYSAYLESDISAHAADYYLLRYFNLNYFNKYLGCNLSISRNVLNVVDSSVTTNGILFDSVADGVGVPDLTYHCRNLQILQLCVSILDDDRFSEVVFNALQLLENLSNNELNINVYGRSPETSYGYSSLLLALSFYCGGGDFVNYDRVETAIVDKFIVGDLEDFEISIGGIEPNEERCGYDSYMYPIVYKLFTLSRCMLSCVINSSFNVRNLMLPACQESLFFDVESGFVRGSWSSNSVLLNLYGHQSSKLRPNDPRYLPCVPYFLELSDQWSSPLVAFQSSCKLPKENIIKKITRLFKTKLLGLYYGSQYVGYHPVFLYKNRSMSVCSNELVSFSGDKIEAQSTKLVSRRQKIRWFGGLSQLEMEELRVRFSISIDDGNLINSYTLNNICEFKYCVRVNVTDDISFEGPVLYLNGNKLITFSLLINKVVSSRVLKCTGGWVRVITFSLTGNAQKLVVKYE